MLVPVHLCLSRPLGSTLSKNGSLHVVGLLEEKSVVHTRHDLPKVFHKSFRLTVLHRTLVLALPPFWSTVQEWAPSQPLLQEASKPVKAAPATSINGLFGLVSVCVL